MQIFISMSIYIEEMHLVISPAQMRCRLPMYAIIGRFHRPVRPGHFLLRPEAVMIVGELHHIMLSPILKRDNTMIRTIPEVG